MTHVNEMHAQGMHADAARSAGFPSYEYTKFPRQFAAYRWYKPLLVALLTFVFMLLFQMAVLLAAAAWEGDLAFLEGVGTSYDTMNPYTGPGALAEMGGIAVLLPALALALIIVRDRPFSSLSSSRGGWNWAAFAKCLLLAMAVYAISTAVEFIIDPTVGEITVRFTVVGFILCMNLIPLQCVAEEYIFRGFIMQTIGSWTKLPAVAIVVSACAFAAGHPYNAIGVATIFINGVIWGIVVWQTRGLEATSAVHIVNNMIAFTMGGLSISATTSEIDILSLVVAVSVDVVYGALVIVLGKRYRWFEPTGDGTAKFNEKYRAKMARKHPQAAIPQAPMPPAAAGYWQQAPMSASYQLQASRQPQMPLAGKTPAAPQVPHDSQSPLPR